MGSLLIFRNRIDKIWDGLSFVSTVRRNAYRFPTPVITGDEHRSSGPRRIQLFIFHFLSIYTLYRICNSYALINRCITNLQPRFFVNISGWNIIFQNFHFFICMKCLTKNWKTQYITFFEKPFSNLLLKEVCWCFEMWVDFTEVKVDASIHVKFAVVNIWWVWNGRNFESSFGSSRRCGKRYHIHNSEYIPE